MGEDECWGVFYSLCSIRLSVQSEMSNDELMTFIEALKEEAEQVTE